MKIIEEIGSHGIVCKTTDANGNSLVFNMTFADLSKVLKELAAEADKLVSDPIASYHTKSTFNEAGRIMNHLPSKIPGR